MASKVKAGAVDPRLRNVKIKTGVVKRLAKEKAMYEREVVEQEAKVEKMKAEGKDQHDIKKQALMSGEGESNYIGTAQPKVLDFCDHVEVLQESKDMVPDCQRRLEAAHNDLTALLETVKVLEDTDDYKKAAEILKEVKL